MTNRSATASCSCDFEKQHEQHTHPVMLSLEKEVLGCDVTLLDVPVSSLTYAQQRVIDEKLQKQCRAVAASAAALPFGKATFGTISHSDVLFGGKACDVEGMQTRGNIAARNELRTLQDCLGPCVCGDVGWVTCYPPACYPPAHRGA